MYFLKNSTLKHLVKIKHAYIKIIYLMAFWFGCNEANVGPQKLRINFSLFKFNSLS